jgi:hypothetical protein
MKYLVPVVMTIAGHIEVEIPGKVTDNKKRRAIKLAKQKYDGRDSIEAPVVDVDFCDDIDSSAI